MVTGMEAGHGAYLSPSPNSLRSSSTVKRCPFPASVVVRAHQPLGVGRGAEEVFVVVAEDGSRARMECAPREGSAPVGSGRHAGSPRVVFTTIAHLHSPVKGVH
jgi:hypothetical protein